MGPQWPKLIRTPCQPWRPEVVAPALIIREGAGTMADRVPCACCSYHACVLHAVHFSTLGSPARLKGPTLAGGRGSRGSSSSWGCLALTPFYARSQARPQEKKKIPAKKKRKYLRTGSILLRALRLRRGSQACVVEQGRMAKLRSMHICVFYISQPPRLASPRGGSTVAPRLPLSYLCVSAHLAAGHGRVFKTP